MKNNTNIIADSKSNFNRITTFKIKCDINTLKLLLEHKELSITYTDISKINTLDLINYIKKNPFIPIAWPKDKHDTEYWTEKDLGNNNYSVIKSLENSWLQALSFACDRAKFLQSDGLAKQHCNRFLEPFMLHTVLITATEWKNFFALRCPKYKLTMSDNIDNPYYLRSKKDWLKTANTLGFPYRDISEYNEYHWLSINKGQAEIHMMALAEAMWDAMNESTPKELKAGEWHTPFSEGIDFSHDYWGTITPKNENDWVNEVKLKISTTRCARIFYNFIENKPKNILNTISNKFVPNPDYNNESNYINDFNYYNELKDYKSFVHCAKAMDYSEYQLNISGKGKTYSTPTHHNYKEVVEFTNSSKGFSDNYKGFIQYSKII